MNNSDIYKVVKNSYETNSYYEKYRKDRVLNDMERLFLDRIACMAGKNYHRVLDICCGDGRLYDAYLGMRDVLITGVDISQKQINCAKQSLYFGKFICDNFIDMDTTQFKNIMIVMCMYGIFNFMGNDTDTLLRKVDKMLLPGGVFFFNVRKEIFPGIKYHADWCDKPMYWFLPGVDFYEDKLCSMGYEVYRYDNPYNDDYTFIWAVKK